MKALKKQLKKSEGIASAWKVCREHVQDEKAQNDNLSR
jgi:hypothetical protein